MSQINSQYFSIKDQDCLVKDPEIAQYRSQYSSKLQDVDSWKVYASIYLNGKIICELPLMKSTDECAIHPAVCIGLSVKVKLMMNYRPHPTNSNNNNTPRST
jgi:hypothetical protein